jgi:L-ascorbate metabolism protein UlaG (beta-lactamase superfamily)
MVALLLAAALTASSSGTPAVSTPQPGTAGSTSPAPRGIELSWLGQSCFLIRTPAGTTVVTDPVAQGMGFHPPTVKADLVTISHAHPDHDNVALVEVAGAAAGGAEVVRGLTKTGDFASVDESVGDVHVSDVPSFHDDQQGARYGKNAIFVFDVGGRRIVHLGDLGTTLDKDQLAAIGAVDVLMVPVGGYDTITSREAQGVVDQLHPRFAVIPMHYRTPQSRARELDTADAFLAGQKNVVHADVWTLPSGAAQPAAPAIVVLKAP